MEDKKFDEANAVGWTTMRSPNGFVWSYTLRGNLLGEVFTNSLQFEEFAMGRGYIPEVKSYGSKFPPKEEGPTQPCAVHGIDMKQKVSKKGTIYHSHSEGVYPDLRMCFGKGFIEKQP